MLKLHLLILALTFQTVNGQSATTIAASGGASTSSTSDVSQVGDPDGDPDDDGLTNFEEAALHTNPNDSNSDDDDLLDGEDADPRDKAINWKRTPEPRYAFVEIEGWNSWVHGEPIMTNNKGMLLCQKAVWKDKVWTRLDGSNVNLPLLPITVSNTYKSNAEAPIQAITLYDPTATSIGNDGVIAGYATGKSGSSYGAILLPLAWGVANGATPVVLGAPASIEGDPKNYNEKDVAYTSRNGIITAIPIDTFSGESPHPMRRYLVSSPTNAISSSSSSLRCAGTHARRISRDGTHAGRTSASGEDFGQPWVWVGGDPQDHVIISGANTLDLGPLPSSIDYTADIHTMGSTPPAGPVATAHERPAVSLGGQTLIYNGLKWMRSQSLRYASALSISGTALTSSLADPAVWRNGKIARIKDLCPDLAKKGIISFDTIDINDQGVILIKASYSNRIGILLPVVLKAFKRGTLNTPGTEVPTGTGEFGYETVMMENADSESSATSTSRDCDESGASADLNAHRKGNDDDLVKVVLKWPAGIKPAGASLKLLHDGMRVDATQTTASAAVSTGGPSRLNFYEANGKRITNTTTDLQIADLANAPASSYLSKILTDGEVTIFIEGADRFGDLPANPTLLGGAQLKWEFSQGGTTTTEKLLIYRGGFLRFMQPAGSPGTVGDFEFWDGKGRLKNKVGKPIFGKEFETDVTDYGIKLATWKAKSGKTIDNPVEKIRGKAYNVKDGYGHTPPGWWRTERRTDFTGKQSDQITGTGSNKKIKQGGYVRWKQDDETAGVNRYTNPYRYDAANTHDVVIGEPTTIRFKFDMIAIAPGTAQSRSDIQIHPDGECADNVMAGTAGCIGIQTYNDCLQVDGIFQRFHGLKVKVQLK